jgi:hypothetical protein
MRPPVFKRCVACGVEFRALRRAVTCGASCRKKRQLSRKAEWARRHRTPAPLPHKKRASVVYRKQCAVCAAPFDSLAHNARVCSSATCRSVAHSRGAQRYRRQHPDRRRAQRRAWRKTAAGVAHRRRWECSERGRAQRLQGQRRYYARHREKCQARNNERRSLARPSYNERARQLGVIRRLRQQFGDPVPPEILELAMGRLDYLHLLRLERRS